jgi:hypothetical protein
MTLHDEREAPPALVRLIRSKAKSKAKPAHKLKKKDDKKHCNPKPGTRAMLPAVTIAGTDFVATASEDSKCNTKTASAQPRARCRQHHPGRLQSQC